MKAVYKQIVMTTVLCVLSASVSAFTQQKTGFGGVASNLMGPVGFFSDFVNSACFLIGGSFLVASVIKYFEHRRSPLMVPISTVVFLVVAGAILVALPFLRNFTG